MAEALYRRHRPAKFKEVTGQDHVKKTIINQIKNGQLAHAYLFTGPRGVGKTTIARIIAKAANCEKPSDGEPCGKCEPCKLITEGKAMDIYEIDAASHTDVANVRENIIENIRFAPNQLKYKVFIIDEVHMLSTHAFNALLKTMEEPPSHALFILATTEIHKVPQTIISRTQRFDFRRLPISLLVERMKSIAKSEGIEVDDQVLSEVARHSDGCARDAESLLGQVFALGEKKIDMEIASLVLPASNMLQVTNFARSLVDKNVEQGIAQINEFVGSGLDCSQFVDDLVDLLRNLILIKLGDESKTELYSQDISKDISLLANDTQIDFLKRSIEAFLETKRGLRSDKIPHLGIELALIGLCASHPTNQDFLEPTKEAELVVEKVSEEKENRPEEKPNLEEKIEEEVADSPKVLGDIPVIAMDDVEKKWPDIFQQIKNCNASLPLVMQTGKISSVNGNEVEIAFEYQLHADTVNQLKNKQILEQAFEEVLGHKVLVRGKYAHKESDETVDAILEEFGGSVA